MRAQQEQEAGDTAKCTSALSEKTNMYNTLTEDLDAAAASYRKNGADAYSLKIDRKQYTDEKNLAERDLAEAAALRKAEKEANDNIVEGAEAGKKAIEEAIKVVEEFMGRKTTGTRRSRGASNVKAMLEVIGTDFDVSKKEAADAEKQQAADFLKAETELKSQIAVVEANLSSTNDALNTKVADANNDLKEMKDKRTESLTVLAALVTQNQSAECKPKGQMTYAERKQARRDEIKALKEALEIIGES